MSRPKAPSLDVLRTFLAVYRTGSFTAAARELAITQPTVTNHIAQLEAAARSELFLRNPGGAQPTAPAHEMAAAVGEHLDQVERFFVHDIVGESGARVLHIGGPVEFTSEFLLPALSGHLPELPPMEFTFDVAGELISRLSAGRLDLIVSTIRPRGDGITAWPLIDEEFVLVGSPEMAVRAVGDGADRYRHFPIVSYGRKLPIIRRYWASEFGQAAEFGPAMLLPSLTAVRAAVVAGFGVSVLPHYLVAEHLARGELVALERPEVAPLNTIFLATMTGTLTRRPSLAAAVDTIRVAIRDRDSEHRRHKIVYRCDEFFLLDTIMGGP